MSLKKNQIFETTIESLSSDGSGIAHVEGQAVFVPGAAPGDVIRCRIVKALKSYAFGRIDAILAPGPGRVAPDCAVCTPCGRCCSGSGRRGGREPAFLQKNGVNHLQIGKILV